MFGRKKLKRRIAALEEELEDVVNNFVAIEVKTPGEISTALLRAIVRKDYWLRVSFDVKPSLRDDTESSYANLRVTDANAVAPFFLGEPFLGGDDLLNPPWNGGLVADEDILPNPWPQKLPFSDSVLAAPLSKLGPIPPWPFELGRIPECGSMRPHGPHAYGEPGAHDEWHPLHFCKGLEEDE